ncbi:MAG TPA: PEGA domain-containing protein, partial [Polyangiaceae bacterium]|nr:PEGA domain-containing protein [Polyangiaceae bacterium]
MISRFLPMCALFGALLLAPFTARAEGADPKKAEAAQRFDRGLQLFDDGDNAGALAEFKKTYELFPNPIVLYNIGLVYAAMGRPVNAVDALEPVVSGGSLTGEKLERAKRTLEDQKARIGRLTVTTKPEGARIEIDNVEVAKTPLTGPLRVAEGNHIVGAIAEGYAPARKEVVVAGNSDATVSLELVETQGKQLANLTVKSQTRGADVVVDGQATGKTPLSTSITLVAGHHKVELKRSGYVSETREVDVGEGATGELSFNLAVDQAALGTEGATLAIESDEHGLDVSVDGEHKGIYQGAMRLPKGPHHLSIAAAGFYPVDRDVDLESGKPNVVHMELEPTPETRADYESSAYFHRTWGWIGI